ncbi:SDR family oxidoreductase [Chitinophaga japonensis]|uniref:NADP-dependent 3-hydroxy acid dehydrogenase YdfG n=1 Tax=Chitinophaga japonensis TaxID=104662 RepID=A0A562SSX7_CHIJA|nr:SDR family oxidoreductase [Chitinophaga japonensis]TWI84243.1 NADP-dependent 3-hydroxy acid dehydrogenase YdfG [Chitinophaga japonensis]
MNRTWLITGTSSGIGRAMTEALLAQGDAVFATLRNTALLDPLQQQYPGRFKAAHLELTDREAIKSVVAQAFDAFEKIDVVVSNAGYGVVGAAEEFDDETILKQLETNLIGSIALIRAVLPYLRRQAGGHIIQVSSEGGQVAYPGFSIYHASKWGIEGFVETVAQEVAPFNIRFTLAEPGPTATNFGAGIQLAPSMAAYDNTPADTVRKMLLDNGFGPLDDVRMVADALIACGRSDNPPLRLPTGPVAFQHLEDVLQKRLQDIRTQKAAAQL